MRTQARDWFYSAEFWAVVARNFNPMVTGVDDEKLLTPLARRTGVPIERLRDQLYNYLRSVVHKREIHPGNNTVH